VRVQQSTRRACRWGVGRPGAKAKQCAAGNYKWCLTNSSAGRHRCAWHNRAPLLRHDSSWRNRCSCTLHWHAHLLSSLPGALLNRAMTRRAGGAPPTRRWAPRRCVWGHSMTVICSTPRRSCGQVCGEVGGGGGCDRNAAPEDVLMRCTSCRRQDLTHTTPQLMRVQAHRQTPPAHYLPPHCAAAGPPAADIHNTRARAAAHVHCRAHHC
jgi:hypothetical protein